MKRNNYMYRVILPIVMVVGLVMSGCSSPFENTQKSDRAGGVQIQAQVQDQSTRNQALNDQVKMASLAPISELDSADGTMRIMEQSLFRPSPEVKEGISQTVIDYLSRIGNTDYRTVTGQEGLDLILPDEYSEFKAKVPELVKSYRDSELVYEVKDLETDLVLVTPLGARVRVKGTLNRTGTNILNLSEKPFLAFFYLKEYQGKWYIESAPSMSFLAEMKLLSEEEKQQIKDILHKFIYGTLQWDYHTVTGKEGFEYLAPPQFNDKVLSKIAEENTRRYKENEWVQTVNNLMVYFIYGTNEEARATVTGTLDRSGITDVQKNSAFEIQYQLKKVDGKWMIANIDKFEG